MIYLISTFLLISTALYSIDETDIRKLGEKYDPNLKIEAFTPLTGGSVNPVFKVKTPDQELVFRFGPEWQSLEDFANEVTVSHLAGEADISPKLYYFNPQSKGMILQFIPGDSFDKLGKKKLNHPATIQKVADLIRKTHSFPKSLPYMDESEISPYAFFENDALQFRENGYVFGPEFDEALAYIREVKNELSEVPPLLIHKDLHSGNIVYGENGTVYLIDWTFVGYGDPYFDIAKAAYRFEYPTKLLQAYLQKEPTEKEMHHFELMYGVYLLERYFEWLEQFVQKTKLGENGEHEKANAMVEFDKWKTFTLSFFSSVC